MSTVHGTASLFRPRTTLGRALLLWMTGLALAAAICPVGGFLDGLPGAAAALGAAGVCLAGSTTALVSTHVLREAGLPLEAVLLGMGIRMGVPLAVALVCCFRAGPLANAGFLYYLLIFYPLTLLIETALSLPTCRQGKTPAEPTLPTNPTRIERADR